MVPLLRRSHGERQGGLPIFTAQGDLATLAGALADLLAAPVTIEDPDTLVLAYSGGQQDVDDARVRTILARQVPRQLQEAIAATGVRRHLERSDEVFVVDLPDVRMIPRAVVALRHQGRLWGSIWAATPSGPSLRQREILAEAAPVIATQLHREHSSSTDSERRRGRLLATLLAGGEEADVAARDQGLGSAMAVVVLQVPEEPPAARVAAALELHLSALAPTAVCAPLEGGVYAVVPAEAGAELVGDFLRRYRHADQIAAAVGTTVAEAALLPRSRHAADEVAAAMGRRGRVGSVGSAEDQFAAMLTDHAEGFFRTYAESSPLTRLHRHDAEHHDRVTDTVAAFLEHGEVSVAAEELGVHPNTVRNRLRRARTACGVDVRDADVRLAVLLHLRLAERTSRGAQD
ncbi:MAG TPA: helix-turn-helix domain-containing protein [Beutenbergiaceae bacterium]|nr:helix-turn-helix domain-containing protein [Beutenbergiaceae bacterium]